MIRVREIVVLEMERLVGTSLEQWDEGRGHPGRLLTPPDLYRALVPKTPWHDPRVRDIDVCTSVASIASIAGGPYDLPTTSSRCDGGAGELFLRRFADAVARQPHPQLASALDEARMAEPARSIRVDALQIIFDALMLCTSGAALDAVAPYRRSDGVGHGDGVAAFRALEVEVKRRPRVRDCGCRQCAANGWV